MLNLFLLYICKVEILAAMWTPVFNPFLITGIDFNSFFNVLDKIHCDVGKERNHKLVDDISSFPWRKVKLSLCLTN
jgi:hypothetical protein